MELITQKIENNDLVIALHGRLDSNNASEADKTINVLYNENKDRNIILDAEDLNYISSAGLRVILHLLKMSPNLKIINVNNNLYDVFEMTGFTEMLTIEKAYRKVSIEDCPIVGEGANGKVYRLDSETVVKVFKNPDALPDIHRERDLARFAFIKGIPTAISYDVVKVGDRYGSIFELLNADSIAKALIETPDKFDELVKMFVDLLKSIHSNTAKEDELPSQKEMSLEWLEKCKCCFTDEEYQKVYNLLNSVPEENRIIHGDYHLKNVLIQNGEPLLIDMDSLARGNVVFEFAGIYNAYIGFYNVDPIHNSNFFGLTHELEMDCWDRVVELYFGITDPHEKEIVALKSRFVGYIRILKRMIRLGALESDEGKKKIEYVKNSIIDLTSVLKDIIL